jgi:hypothetical protein
MADVVPPLSQSPLDDEVFCPLCDFHPESNIKRLSHIRRAHPGVTLSDAFIAMSAARCSKCLGYYKAAGLSAHESVCGSQGSSRTGRAAVQGSLDLEPSGAPLPPPGLSWVYGRPSTDCRNIKRTL